MKSQPKLVWVGKDKPAAPLEPHVLQEDPKLSYKAAPADGSILSDLFGDVFDRGSPGTFDNLLVQGDNLLALRALERDLTGKVKCVYIDPPYNTKQAFEHYDDGVEHSSWLSMMRERLEVLWRLLSEDGSLWVSIDDREVAYLRVLLDEICGRHSFVACNVWQKRYSRENRAAIGDSHEYVVVYAKDAQRFKTARNQLPMNAKQLKTYRNPNNDPLGPWRTTPLTAQAGHGRRETQFYEITGPTGRVFGSPLGTCWRYTKDVYEQLVAEGKIYFGKDGNAQPRKIRYLSESTGLTPWTWWPHEEVGHTQESKREIYALFGREQAFDTPKPERLLQRILHIASGPGDLVLDAFAGSGTTAAVAHKMGRRWIALEIGDHAKVLIQKRMVKVIDGTDPGGVTGLTGWGGGGGFRFYNLVGTK